jgi:hypothetical protein
MSPEESGFIVLRIDGLGPPKAEISLTERAAVDGSLYNSGRATPRNIVMALRFYPGQDIEALRQKTYKYFPLNRPIEIEIQASHRTVKAIAYVEVNEPDVFSKEAGCVITMMFPDSYLYDTITTLTVFSSIDPVFEFPWSNESTVSPLLEMSILDLETTKTIVYVGDVSIGMLLHIHANGSANDFVLTDTDTLEALAIDSAKLVSITGSDIIAGDDIWVSTVIGNKYAVLIRGSTTWNILSALGTSPPWFQLEKGDNVYAYDADSGLGNLTFVIHHDTAFEGV